MLILSTGPVVGSGAQARLIVSVQDDDGNRFRIRLFKDYAYSLTPQDFKTAIRGVLSHRSTPDPRFQEFRGVEI